MPTILSVTELRARTGGDDDEGNATAKRKLLVKTNSRYVDYLSILADQRVPPIGSYYVNPATGVVNPGLVVKSRDAEAWEKKPEWWYVTLNYSTVTLDPLQRRPPGGGEEIVNRAPRVSYQSWSYTQAFAKDVAGKAVQNSAGQPFDPAPETEVKELQITVVYALAQFSGKKFTQYINTINKSTWKDRPAKTIRVADISAEPKFEFNTRYDEVTMVLQEKSVGWTREILDRGMQKKVGGEFVNLRDKYGRDVTGPVLLDGSGAKATLPSDGHFLTFKEFREIDFSDLGIDHAEIT